MDLDGYDIIIDELENQEIYKDDLDLTDSEKDILDARFDQYPAFNDAWSINYTRRFYDEMKYKLGDPSKPMNFLQRKIGKPGRGKSQASLFDIYLQHEFLDISYKICFSKIELIMLMAHESKEANRTNNIKRRITYDLDEDPNTQGYGSGALNKYFDNALEFLRAAQINMHVLNPYDISSIDTQLEVIGYTNSGYAKSILFAKLDIRSDYYKPMGYVITKLPPKPYREAYDIKKQDFLQHFISNRSYHSAQNTQLLNDVKDDLKKDDLERIRQAVLLNKESIADTILQRELNNYNFPIDYNRQLINLFKLKFFSKERDLAFKRKTENIAFNKAMEKEKLEQAKIKTEQMRQMFESMKKANTQSESEG